MPPLQLVVFSGLPGAGKSTFADLAGRELGCPVFSKDELHASLKRSGLSYDRAGWMSHELLTLLANNQLRLGQSAVLDSVTALQKLRDGWHMLADGYGAVFRPVECVCSDAEVHRQRLEARRRGAHGLRDLAWDDVAEVAARYEPWEAEQPLVLDSAGDPAANLRQLRAYLGVTPPD